jgi:hypothetical protein
LSASLFQMEQLASSTRVPALFERMGFPRESVTGRDPVLATTVTKPSTTLSPGKLSQLELPAHWSRLRTKHGQALNTRKIPECVKQECERVAHIQEF